MSKNKYLTENEIHNLEVAIYNDDHKTFVSLLSKINQNSDQREDKQLEANAKKLAKGQKYEYIKDTHYIITQRGIVYNARHNRRIRLTFIPNNFLLHIHKNSYKIDELMQEVGFTFDFEDTLKCHLENNFDLIVNPLYKEKYQQAIY